MEGDQAGFISSRSGGTLPIKRAKLDAAAATADQVLVAAVAGKKIRVIAIHLSCGTTATTIVFKSKPAGASAAISHTIALAVNEKAHLLPKEYGYFETVAGEGLVVTTTAGSVVGVLIDYVEK